MSQFIAAGDVLASFKFHPRSPPAVFVVADTDWRAFSARRLTSWRVPGKGERTPFGTIAFDAAARRAEVSPPSVRSAPESFAFEQVPAHLYNLDEVIVPYLSDERRGGVAARKYCVDGAVLQNRAVLIWVSRERGWMEDMEIDLPDNPEWTSFKFKLLRVEKMSRVQWDEFMETQL